ncbi:MULTISPECIES: sigma-70 family RNA polymerase sigma factor [Paenibacillus]|uniref:RNA polymerase subunit sigma-24 n=1 Tax=Paenibacillus lautus TaxID=1401 RepID=A0A1R1B3L6_PAELA|nr:sigma-70 family RNA polymerase sigma factor [Paenibacillus lautus]OME93734.1 hypothetical protein BK123_10810 [Paenibacillus lautus]
MLETTADGTTIETMEDRILTERAKAGDTEAFGELVRRHRTSARSWARSMTRDTHMAEDIVQDSLIKAFLHVGQLIDSSRFMGWLRAIVRRQAQMKLRRGGPYRIEQPFTSLKPSQTMDSANIDWGDVDHILQFLSVKLTHKQNELNPETLYLRKETIEMIQSFLHGLSRKERGIFEAYFFKQWSPDEIAAMFQTTTQSVYTYIYRAKRKVREEHSRMLIPASSGKPDQEENGGNSWVKKLPLPRTRTRKTASSLIDTVSMMLDMTNHTYSVSDLIGRSGSAFRLRISGLSTYADGAFVFDWQEVLRQLFDGMGYETAFVSGQLPDEGIVPLVPVASSFPFAKSRSPEVMNFVREYLIAGTPVMFFDTYVQKPFTFEWSLIYGYDDGRQELYVTDPSAPYMKTITYEELTTSSLRFLCGIKKRPEQVNDTGQIASSSMAEQLSRIARVAVEGDGYSPRTPFPYYVQGLAAYDAWRDHLKRGEAHINLHGMSYLIRVYGDARRHAVTYLRDLKDRWSAQRGCHETADSGIVHDSTISSEYQINEAYDHLITCYEESAKMWTELETLFPFPCGTGSSDPEAIVAASDLLKRAHEQEREAMRSLQFVIDNIRRDHK